MEATSAPPLLRPVQRSPSAEKIFSVVALVLLSGAFLHLIFPTSEATKDFTDPILIQMMQLGTFAVAVALLLQMRLGWNERLYVPVPLILLLGYTLVSFAWSIAPELTLKRYIPLLGMSLVGVYLGARFTLAGFVNVAFVAFFIMTSASVVTWLLLPQYGIQPGEGAWAGLRGVFINKNTTGGIASVGALVSLYYVSRAQYLSGPRFWLGSAGLLTAAFCLLLSLSASSVIATALAFVAVALLRGVQRSQHSAMPLLGFLFLCVLGVLVITPDKIAVLFNLFGRDTTLTGRVDIWAFTSSLIGARPWLGYGYAVAWDKFGHDLFRVVHVHNGFLQVTLDLGFVGLALLLVCLLQVARRCLSLVNTSRAFIDSFPAALLALLFFGNMTEVTFLAGQSIQWGLLVFVSVQTALDAGIAAPAELKWPRATADGASGRDPVGSAGTTV